jgi:hypothetical protein
LGDWVICDFGNVEKLGMADKTRAGWRPVCVEGNGRDVVEDRHGVRGSNGWMGRECTYFAY